MEEYYLKDGEYGAQFDWPTDTIPSMFEDGPLNQKDLEQLHKGDKDEEDRPPNQKEQLHKADKNKDADMDKPGWGKPEKDSFLVDRTSCKGHHKEMASLGQDHEEDVDLLRHLISERDSLRETLHKQDQASDIRPQLLERGSHKRLQVTDKDRALLKQALNSESDPLKGTKKPVDTRKALLCRKRLVKILKRKLMCCSAVENDLGGSYASPGVPPGVGRHAWFEDILEVFRENFAGRNVERFGTDWDPDRYPLMICIQKISLGPDASYANFGAHVAGKLRWYGRSAEDTTVFHELEGNWLSDGDELQLRKTIVTAEFACPRHLMDRFVAKLYVWVKRKDIVVSGIRDYEFVTADGQYTFPRWWFSERLPPKDVLVELVKNGSDQLKGWEQFCLGKIDELQIDADSEYPAQKKRKIGNYSAGLGVREGFAPGILQPQPTSIPRPDYPIHKLTPCKDDPSSGIASASRIPATSSGPSKLLNGSSNGKVSPESNSHSPASSGLKTPPAGSKSPTKLSPRNKRHEEARLRAPPGQQPCLTGKCDGATEHPNRYLPNSEFEWYTSHARGNKDGFGRYKTSCYFCRGNRPVPTAPLMDTPTAVGAPPSSARRQKGKGKAVSGGVAAPIKQLHEEEERECDAQRVGRRGKRDLARIASLSQEAGMDQIPIDPAILDLEIQALSSFGPSMSPEAGMDQIPIDPAILDHQVQALASLIPVFQSNSMNGTAPGNHPWCPSTPAASGFDAVAHASSMIGQTAGYSNPCTQQNTPMAQAPMPQLSEKAQPPPGQNDTRPPNQMWGGSLQVSCPPEMTDALSQQWIPPPQFSVSQLDSRIQPPLLDGNVARPIPDQMWAGPLPTSRPPGMTDVPRNSAQYSQQQIPRPQFSVPQSNSRTLTQSRVTLSTAHRTHVLMSSSIRTI
jgi:hypothetical protein